MTDSVTGLPSGDYITDNVYRVKALDRDAGGRSGGHFDYPRGEEQEKLGQEGKEESSQQNNNPPPVNVPRQPVDLNDKMLLSEDARRMLEPETATPKQDDAPSSNRLVLPPAQSPNGDDSSPHIDVTA